MYVVIVDIHIQSQHREAFVAAMLENARLSVQDEPGCLQFDVVEDETDPAHLILYEVYADRAAFEEDHLQREHFKTWRDTVREWHAEPPGPGRACPLHPLRRA